MHGSNRRLILTKTFNRNCLIAGLVGLSLATFGAVQMTVLAGTLPPSLTDFTIATGLIYPHGAWYVTGGLSTSILAGAWWIEWREYHTEFPVFIVGACALVESAIFLMVVWYLI